MTDQTEQPAPRYLSEEPASKMVDRMPLQDPHEVGNIVWCANEMLSYDYGTERWLATSTFIEKTLGTILSMTNDRDIMRVALEDAGTIICRLADQQAMPDDWYKDDLERLRDLARSLEEE